MLFGGYSQLTEWMLRVSGNVFGRAKMYTLGAGRKITTITKGCFDEL